MPFRKSHEIVGRWVRKAEKRGISLADLPDEVIRAGGEASSGIAFGEIFDWKRSVEARDVAGGTSRRSVLEQIETARARLLVEPE